MKVPLSWLKCYVNLDKSVSEIAELLTMAGLEVDKVETTALSFSGVVVGKVLETKPHPDADKLKIATVTDGAENFQVVCGASNCREGLVTAFAKLGATLEDPEGKTWKIKKSKIRGIESFGMLCAEDELGLCLEKKPGIMELGTQFELGKDLQSFYSDTVFDITLTPNLGHCMSIYGVARELAALLNVPLKPLPSVQNKPTKPSSYSASIEASESCSTYMCRLVKNVEVGPSPDWLSDKLRLVGISSINNVIDVSTYVMLTTGQPLHFYDADCLDGSSLRVTCVKSPQTFTCLSDETRQIPEGTLVIEDEKKTLAVAGVIGGKSSSVQESTKNVLIESAQFNESTVRKMMKQLQLKTDAALRFEKGIDPSVTKYALDLAAELLEQIAGGQAEEDSFAFHSKSYTPRKLTCRQSKVNALLGLTLSLSEITDMLHRLGFKKTHEDPTCIEVEIPPHRNDVHLEVDLIEEIARIYGFQNLPKKASKHYTTQIQSSEMYKFENTVRDELLKGGLYELMTCDLISPFLSKLADPLIHSSFETLEVLQSKSQDFSLLRHSLFPGLLQVAKYNYDHGNQDLAGFEVGRVHYRHENRYKEEASAAIVLTGKKAPHHFDPEPQFFDFFDLKGKVETLLCELNLKNYSFTPSHNPSLQPGRQAYIEYGKQCLGIIGQVHPNILAKIDMPQDVLFAEINVDALIKLRKKNKKVKPLPQYPASERDWTVTISKKTAVAEIHSAIQSYSSSCLEDVYLLDVYENDSIGSDRKNITWRFIYRDPSKTLDIQTVEKEHLNLIQKVAEKLGSCIL